MRTSTLSGPVLLITSMAVSAADIDAGQGQLAEHEQTTKVTRVKGLVRRSNMEGSCWSLQTPSGNHYQLHGGDIDLYRDGQFVLIQADNTIDISQAQCGIGPVLQAVDYTVIEADQHIVEPLLSVRR
jgi:hypothetical protein